MGPALIAFLGAIFAAVIAATGTVLAARRGKSRVPAHVELVACNTHWDRNVSRRKGKPEGLRSDLITSCTFDVTLRNSGEQPAVIVGVHFEYLKCGTFPNGMRPSFTDEPEPPPIPPEGGGFGGRPEYRSSFLKASSNFNARLPSPTFNEATASHWDRSQLLPPNAVERFTATLWMELFHQREWAIYLIEISVMCGDRVDPVRTGKWVLATSLPDFRAAKDSKHIEHYLGLRAKWQGKLRDVFLRNDIDIAALSGQYPAGDPALEIVKKLYPRQARRIIDILRGMDAMRSYYDSKIRSASIMLEFLAEGKMTADYEASGNPPAPDVSTIRRYLRDIREPRMRLHSSK